MNRRTSILILMSASLSLLLSAAAWAAQQAPAAEPQSMPAANPSPSQQALPAPGQPGQDTTVPSFGDLDKNHDGKLVRGEIPKNVEALKPLRAHFREADLDGNGSLSEQEYAAYTMTKTPSGL